MIKIHKNSKWGWNGSFYSTGVHSPFLGVAKNYSPIHIWFGENSYILDKGFSKLVTHKDWPLLVPAQRPDNEDLILAQVPKGAKVSNSLHSEFIPLGLEFGIIRMKRIRVGYMAFPWKKETFLFFSWDRAQIVSLEVLEATIELLNKE